MEYEKVEVEGKWVKHVHKEGSRFHALYYDTNGVHCNVENCEINKIKGKGNWRNHANKI